MEGVYYFGDYLRWNLGQPNPNVAGALVALLLAWLIPWQLGLRAGTWRKKVIHAGVSLAAFALWFVLLKTYSRRAFVAVFLSQGVCFLALFLSGRQTRLIVLRRFLVSLLIVAALCVATGFFARIAPAHLQNDGSVSARLTLWQGALALTADRPLSGWGAGRSGQAYMDWYQSLDDTRRYAGTVNSYLHMASERGLPVLAMALAAGFSFLFLGHHTVRTLAARKQSGGKPADTLCFYLVGAAMNSLGVFLVLNFFSTLWVFPVLWYGAGVALLVIALAALRLAFVGRGDFNLFKKAFLRGTTLSVFACLLVFAAGVFTGRGSALRYKDDCVVLGRGDQKIGVLCDKGVLGALPGKSVRALAREKTFAHSQWIVPYPLVQMPEHHFENCQKLIVAGVAVRALTQESVRGKTLYLLNPIGRPDLSVFKHAEKVILILGAIDELRQHPYWLNAAATNHWPVHTLPNYGQDLSCGDLEDIPSLLADE